MVDEQLLSELTAHLKRTGGGNSLLHATVAVVKELRPWITDTGALGPARELYTAFLEQAAVAANKLGEDKSGDLLTRSTEYDRAWDALKFYGLRYDDELRLQVKEVVKRARELKQGSGKRLPTPSPTFHGPGVRQALRKSNAGIQRIAEKMAATPSGNLPPPNRRWWQN